MIELRWRSLADYEYVPPYTPMVMIDIDGLARNCVLQSRRSVGFTDANDPVWSDWQDVPVDAP